MSATNAAPPLPAAGIGAAAAAVRALAARGWQVATAESCTGGLVAALLTTEPGSSTNVLGSIVAYVDAVKVAQLGVDPGVLAAHGAVSEATALAMAEGVRARLGADVGVSVTGLAGPAGDARGNPVGRVWIGLATLDGARATRFDFSGDRHAVRLAATIAALDAVRAAASAR